MISTWSPTTSYGFTLGNIFIAQVIAIPGIAENLLPLPVAAPQHG